MYESTMNVLELEPQGLQEEDQTLCCPQFMKLQNMSWRQNNWTLCVHGSWTDRTCAGDRTSRTERTKLDSLLSTVHEPTEHVLETESQGLEEQNWTLSCPRFMNLQNMSWRENLKDYRKKTRLFAVHGSWTYRTCSGDSTSRSAGRRANSLLSTVHEPTEHVLE